MNRITNSPLKGLLFLVGLCFWIPSCRGTFDGMEPSRTIDDITKEHRKKLGKSIAFAIKNNPDTFQLVRPERNPEAFIYFDSMYQTAYWTIRHERYITEDDWDDTRKWNFNILVSDQKMAFCIPGGDFYITTKFLDEAVKADYNLFYIMTFEAILMDEQFLLTKLLNKKFDSANELIECAESDFEAQPWKKLDLANEIFGLFKYEAKEIKAIDDKTIDSICDRSPFSRRGIVDIEDTIAVGTWFDTRPDYAGREAFVSSLESISEEYVDKCGNRFDYKYQTPNLIDTLIARLDYDK